MHRTLATLVLLPLLCLATACIGPPYPPGPPHASGPGPQVSVEVSFFYDDLAPYGDWRRVEPYGWVWTPWNTPAGWRPYTVGRWIYTADGWTWVSDWRWGWAPFHYGRWDWQPGFGWIWIPGRTWAPAWVVWRHGPGWVGWAPLPPGVEWRAGVGLWLGNVNLDMAIGSSWWVFVGERDFLEHRPLRRAVPVTRNPEILRRTRDVTRYDPVGDRVVDRGLPLEEVERAVGRAVPQYKVRDLPEPPQVKERIDRDRVRVYRPEPSRKPVPREPPAKKPKKAVPRKPPPP